MSAQTPSGPPALRADRPGGRKPLVLYDADCSFCIRRVTRLKRLTGSLVEYAPGEKSMGSLQLIEPGGRVSLGAQAVFRLCAYLPRFRWLLWVYENFPGVSFLAGRIYPLIAKYRKHLPV